VAGEDGTTYYIACSAATGVIQNVDTIVDAADTRFSSVATIAPQEAGQRATALYKGEIEEVKAVLTTHGEALYEVDVESSNGKGTATSEFNVWVDAATGRIHHVDIEYWEIGN
jgi:hypothetical protein